MKAAKFELYAVLGVSQKSSIAEVTRAYRKLALQFHPDRNPDGVDTFKAISNAYAILGDNEKRAIYDLTGFTSDAASAGSYDGMADETARQQRSAELADQVRDFFATYAGSEEEREDVMKGYRKCDGNFKKMVREYLLFDNGIPTEVQRLHRLVEQLIVHGKLNPTETWTETSSMKSILKIEKAMKREREEAEEALKVLAGGDAAADGDGGLGALQLTIRQRQESSYQSMLNSLEAKYVTNRKQKKTATKRPRESEEEEDNNSAASERRRKHNRTKQ